MKKIKNKVDDDKWVKFSEYKLMVDINQELASQIEGFMQRRILWDLSLDHKQIQIESLKKEVTELKRLLKKEMN